MSSQLDTTPLLHPRATSIHGNVPKKRTMFARALVAVFVLFVFGGSIWLMYWLMGPGENMESDFKVLKDYCKDVPPIQPREYAERQQRLAHTLQAEGYDAIIMEPGPTMLYYTNVAWSLSERPFVIVLQLDTKSPLGIHTTVVTPAFEAGRARENIKHAQLPPDITLKVIEWAEHESPYSVISQALQGGRQDHPKKVAVEPNARLFIYEGVAESLGEAAAVRMAPRAFQTLRMVKSPSELEILRCANRVTALAIKTVRPHVRVGMTEAEIATLMETALHTAGLTNTWVLALVDENAAFPHGEPGQEKRVKKHSTVLIDTGGELLGYQSDTTRTFFMGKRGENQTLEDAWYTVHRAQENVLNLLSAGQSCASVDLTARHVIEKAGYGASFTHRLGHGIGMEMHEEPYMNQGNKEQLLQQGFTFSVEPGIYVEQAFGIRLEDIVFVNQDGRLELLTSGLAQNPWTL